MCKHTKKSKEISTELRNLSKQFQSEGRPNYHNDARCEINKKYGKFWRSELDKECVFSTEEACLKQNKGRFDNMSYY